MVKNWPCRMHGARRHSYVLALLTLAYSLANSPRVPRNIVRCIYSYKVASPDVFLHILNRRKVGNSARVPTARTTVRRA